MLRAGTSQSLMMCSALLRGHETVRYFFHTINGDREPDLDGTNLPGLDAARKMAVIYSAQMLADDPHYLWTANDFRVEVSDAHNRLLFTVVTQAYHPAQPDMTEPS
jgi:hypothetical protein